VPIIGMKVILIIWSPNANLGTPHTHLWLTIVYFILCLDIPHERKMTRKKRYSIKFLLLKNFLKYKICQTPDETITVTVRIAKFLTRAFVDSISFICSKI
jgi:hypothetical protein